MTPPLTGTRSSGGPLTEACEAAKRRAVTDAPGALADAERLVLEAKAPRDRVRALGARAHARCYANDFAGAAADLADALSIADDAGLADEAPDLRLVSVQPLARSGRLAEALDAATRASDGFAALGLRAQQGKAEVNRAVVLRMQGQALAALACLDRAVELLGDDPNLLGASHCNRAVALLELDRHADALDAFHSALQALGPSAAIVHGNIADLLGRMGRTCQAVEEFERARELYRASGARADEARLAAEEAEALATAGAYASAADLYRAALPGLDSLPREQARALLGLGLVHLGHGRAGEAEATLRQALQRAEACGATLVRAEAAAALARACSALKRHAEAFELMHEAVGRLAGRPIRCLVARISGVEIALSAGRHADARAWLDGPDVTSGGHIPLPVRASLDHARARVSLAIGDRSAALNDLRAAVASLETFRLGLPAPVVRAAVLESSRRVYLDLATTALDALSGDEGLATAVSALERVRARTLLDALRDNPASEPARSHTDETLARTDRDVIDELNVLYAALGPAPSAGSADNARRMARLREVEAMLEVRSLAGASRGGPPLSSEPEPLERLIASRPPGAAMISVFDDGPDVSAIVIGPGGASAVRRLTSRADLARLRARFDLDLARALGGLRPPEPRLIEHLSAIGRLLLTPLEPLMGPARRVLLSNCPLLEDVPLHALSAAGVFSRRIETVPSLSLATTRGRVATGGASGPLIVAVPDDSAPATVDEARAVAAIHPGARLLVGDQASSGATLDVLPTADLVHLACHAVFDPRFPLSSRLRLSDRWVTARELLGRLRPGATVILAGCSTGAGSGREDALGLHRAAIASGAAAVLSSLWPLHDQTARDLLPQIHTRLVERSGPMPLRLAPALADVLAMAHARRIPAHLWANLTVTGVAA